MEWRDIPGFDGKYQVSTTGQVRSVGTRVSPRIMKLHIRPRDGYACVGIVSPAGRKTMKVHRLVALAFIPNDFDLHDVDHINGVKADNRVENLRWASKISNALNRHTALGEFGAVGVARSNCKSKPYRAHIKVSGVKLHLGTFKSIAEAKAARQKAYQEATQ